MVEVWGIKNCQSVKKALVFLNSRHIEYNFVDYKKNPPSTKMIAEWVKQKGMDKVLNKKGITYRAMSPDIQKMNENELIALMSENPTLIKRPILIDQDILEFGFSKEGYEKFY